LLAWLALGAACVVLHQATLDRTGLATEAHASVARPEQLLGFALAWIGGGLLGQVGDVAAGAAGGVWLAGFVASGAVLWRRGTAVRRPLLPALGVALFAGCAALATAWGRGGYGLHVATTSRYATTAGLAWASLLVLLAAVGAGCQGRARRACVVLGVALCLVLLVGQPASFAAARRFHDRQERQRVALLAGQGLSREVLATIPDHAALAHWLDKLERRRLSLFRGDVRAPAGPSRLSTEIVREAEALVVRVAGGRPGNAARLVLVEAGGKGMHVPLFDADLDAAGALVWRHALPPDAGGLAVQCITVDARGAPQHGPLARWP
jgi:hypothetical protein